MQKRKPGRRKKCNSGYLCMDCGKDTLSSGEYYMLENAVWRRINPLVIGMLCLECAEDRLGRRLCHADFSSFAAINAAYADLCPALADRMRQPRQGKDSDETLVEDRFKDALSTRLAKKKETQSELGRMSARLLIEGLCDLGLLPDLVAILARSGMLSLGNKS